MISIGRRIMEINGLGVEIVLAFAASLSAGCGIALYLKTQKKLEKLAFQLIELEQKVTNLLWQDEEPCVKQTYQMTKAREHSFEFRILNTLNEPINLLEFYTYPPDGKASYVEITFLNEKNPDGTPRLERATYSDKINITRLKTNLQILLQPGQEVLLRYAIKFKDALITSRRPDIYLCYQSSKREGIREIKITDKMAISALKSISDDTTTIRTSSALQSQLRTLERFA